MIAGIVIVGVGALVTRIIRRETELSLRAMEQALGGHTLTASSRRWQPDDYVAWCFAHNVEPYPHGRPHTGEMTHDESSAPPGTLD